MRSGRSQLAQYILVWTSMWTAAVCIEQPVPGRSGRSLTNWIDEGVVNGTTYSVIIETGNMRPSNQFGDKQRVQYFSRFAGGEDRVVSVQYSPLLPEEADDGSLVVGGHLDGVDKRVRMVFVSGTRLWGDDKWITHLSDVCADDSETTIMVIVDETCGTKPTRGLPAACFPHVIRVYTFNTESDERPLQAYIPLGPRNTFPFVLRERIIAASDRPLFLNLQVSVETSPRRSAVAAFVEGFSSLYPEVPLSYQNGPYNALEWQNLLLDSTFTICPGGHNAQTYRLWEALEAGSIPIVSKQDYTHPGYSPRNRTCGTGDGSWNTVASSPFAKEVYVDTWEELPELLLELRQKSDQDINKLQEDCMAWYAARTSQTYTSLLNFGEGNDMFPQQGPIIDIPDDAS